MHAEGAVGSCTEMGIIEDFGEYAPALFGHIAKLRDELTKIVSHLKYIPEFRSTKGVLFVEGWTEEKFLSKLRESHSSWFLNINIEVYG